MQFQDYSVEGVLRDGSPVRIRALRPEDRDQLREGFQRLSGQSVYQRFFRVKRDLSEWELSYLTNLDFRNHVALVAAVKGAAGWEPAGVARLVRLGPQGDVTKGEAAFTVLDAHQGRGIGTQLMVHLARIASALGYTTLEAEVLPDNRPMLTVFAHSGLPIREQVRDGIVHVELTLPRRQEASSAWSGSGAT